MLSVLLGLATVSCDGPAVDPTSDALQHWHATKKPYREQASRRIVEDGVLIGKSRRQISQLLGQPDAADQYGQGEWCYEVGENGLDVVWLRVDFKDDHAWSARLAAD